MAYTPKFKHEVIKPSPSKIVEKAFIEAKEKLKKIKEEGQDVAPIEGIIDDLDKVIKGAIDDLGAANPAVSALVDTAQSLQNTADFSEIANGEEVIMNESEDEENLDEAGRTPFRRRAKREDDKSDKEDEEMKEEDSEDDSKEEKPEEDKKEESFKRYVSKFK